MYQRLKDKDKFAEITQMLIMPTHLHNDTVTKIILICVQGFPQSMLNELNSMIHELTSTTIVHGFWSNLKNS